MLLYEILTPVLPSVARCPHGDEVEVTATIVELTEHYGGYKACLRTRLAASLDMALEAGRC